MILSLMGILYSSEKEQTIVTLNSVGDSFFFDVDLFFEVFIEFVTILLLLYVLFFWL